LGSVDFAGLDRLHWMPISLEIDSVRRIVVKSDPGAEWYGRRLGWNTAAIRIF
jgi:hypothetical protein